MANSRVGQGRYKTRKHRGIAKKTKPNMMWACQKDTGGREAPPNSLIWDILSLKIRTVINFLIL